jgi:hypothetical protein
MAMFMMLMVSALGAAMVHVARTETLSSANYTSMSQARYAAESGVAAASNYLLSNGYAVVMPGTGGDPLSNYNLTVSPVTRNGTPVLLSSDPDVASNYPVAAVITAFQAATGGTLQVGGTAAYSARATLLRMRQFTDGMTNQPVTLQTWEITGIGGRAIGEIAGAAEVSSIIERGTRPVFNYAAFATANGCNALTLAGIPSTDSYDSTVPVASGATPVASAEGGNVGTNGNLGATGLAQVNGTLSTPMTGIGACTANNVTAASLGPGTAITEGLIQLSQPVEFPTPPAPNPAPGTANQLINNPSCTGLPNCTLNGSQVVLTPVGTTPVLLGNVTINGGQTVVLKTGTYHVNSMTLAGGGKIAVDSSSGGPVTIILDGAGGGTKVFDVTGNGIANSTWDPAMLRIQYYGTKELQFDGNGDTASLIYAPNAHATLAGTADFYGSIITRTVDSVGFAKLHYDRALQRNVLTQANPVMTSFTWHTF